MRSVSSNAGNMSIKIDGDLLLVIHHVVETPDRIIAVFDGGNIKPYLKEWVNV